MTLSGLKTATVGRNTGLKILIVGLNYAPELTGIGKYTGEMAAWFASKGHDVKVITAPPYYPEWQVKEGYSSWTYRVESMQGVSVIRCPIYVPRNITTVKRLLHLLSFSVSILPVLLWQCFWRPAVVINPVPSLFSSPLVLFMAWISQAKSVLHIQDFEVDAMLGLGMGSGRVAKLAKWFERFVLSRFDLVSTISKAMAKNAESKGVAPERLVLFPNWSDLSKFETAERNAQLRCRFNVSDQEKMILYSGNIGEKQGLETVVEVARLAQDKPYKFVVVGQGGGRQALEQLVLDKKLSNIAFFPLQPLDDLPDMLASADCHLVVQRKGAADAVLPSKLTNILAAGGNAVITAEPETELGYLCAEFDGIAELVEPESVDALANGIAAVVEKHSPNEVAKEYAARYLDKQQILTDFQQRCSELVTC